LPHTGRVYPFYFQGWSASPDGSAEFKNANALETPVVFKQANATVNANYKGSMLSSSTKALSSTSQRKVVRTPNGHLHIVYESMGKLWYQKSVNNGMTWGEPKLVLDDLGESNLRFKGFSIDYVDNKVYLAAQAVYDDQDRQVSGIFMFEIDESGIIREFPSNTTFSLPVESPEVEATPIVASNYENILFIWRESNSEPLKLVRYRWVGNEWIQSNIISIPYTTPNSINPSVSLVKSWNCSKVYSHFVWEEKISSKRSEIYYTRIMMNRDYVNDTRFESYNVVTKGSGYEICTKPVIVETGEDYAKLGFVGIRRFYDQSLTPTETKAVLTELITNSPTYLFYSYGDDVQSVSLNKCNTRWTFAWARSNDLPVQYVDSRDLRTIYNLGNLTGVDVHISNGANPEDMYAFTLNTSAAPYPINVRTIYGNIIPDEIVVTEDSREGVVNKDGGVVYYSFGDIKAGDTKVEMKDIPDGADITTLENANGYLYSKPFMVNDNTTFVYSIRYGVNDSTALKEALTSTDYIKFRVELIDANSRELLGVFDEVTYNSQNVSKYENINYEVNCSGLGERLVQLRLVIQNNVDPYYALSDKYSDAVYNMQKKKAFKSMDYRGLLSNKVYTYTLYQNYPNPFNPVTKIRFSIKETNPVKIKLYDIVGREVAVIMNEVKDAGEYEIELDAGKLGISSGVYFYQMKAGDYTSIKKMVYLK
jgi:hypothetical protein